MWPDGHCSCGKSSGAPSSRPSWRSNGAARVGVGATPLGKENPGARVCRYVGAPTTLFQNSMAVFGALDKLFDGFDKLFDAFANHLLHSINHLMHSINHLMHSINHLMHSINHLIHSIII